MVKLVRFQDYGLAVAQAITVVAERARQPSVRVAQHWQSVNALTWFGACADHYSFHVSWSFGQLRHAPQEAGRHTVGVFAVTGLTFPGIDEGHLRVLCEGLVPAGTAGATRVFLQRVASQFALVDVLLTLPELYGAEVSVFARPDAVEKLASTPRWPEHAKERVAAALAQMDVAFQSRCERIWAHPAPVLLDAARLSVEAK